MVYLLVDAPECPPRDKFGREKPKAQPTVHDSAKETAGPKKNQHIELMLVIVNEPSTPTDIRHAFEKAKQSLQQPIA